MTVQLDKKLTTPIQLPRLADRSIHAFEAHRDKDPILELQGATVFEAAPETGSSNVGLAGLGGLIGRAGRPGPVLHRPGVRRRAPVVLSDRATHDALDSAALDVGAVTTTDRIAATGPSSIAALIEALAALRDRPRPPAKPRRFQQLTVPGRCVPLRGFALEVKAAWKRSRASW